ncbi:MAG: hypothetical protein AAFR39_09660 [Pseudomonadota bacterium]
MSVRINISSPANAEVDDEIKKAAQAKAVRRKSFPDKIWFS